MKWLKKSVGGRGSSRRARGAAAVEFAVVLPLLLIILLGIIEYGYVFMVQQTVQHAAREGSRVAILQSSVAPSYPEAYARLDDVMAAANLSGYTRNIWLDGNVITAEVTIPHSEFSLVGVKFGNHLDSLTGSCSMRKEGMPAGGP